MKGKGHGGGREEGWRQWWEVWGGTFVLERVGNCAWCGLSGRSRCCVAL